MHVIADKQLSDKGLERLMAAINAMPDSNDPKNNTVRPVSGYTVLQHQARSIDPGDCLITAGEYVNSLHGDQSVVGFQMSLDHESSFWEADIFTTEV